MSINFLQQLPQNEPVLSYLKGSPERVQLERDLATLNAKKHQVPLIIGGKEIHTETQQTLRCPHRLKQEIAAVSMAEPKHISEAIEVALSARKQWIALPFIERISVFLRAADLLATKYRGLIAASTMIGQSKNIYQAEIDSTCEAIDFLKFNAYYLNQIYQNQPISSRGILNRMEYRPLEGFVYAVTPFNFTSIALNLACAPASCGNVVIWKPSQTQALSAYIQMQLLQEAGLPDGVINLVFGDSQKITDICTSHKYFAGLHFTGSTTVFNTLWQGIAQNVPNYVNYPRLVGETGGKDFVMVHKTAAAEEVVNALVCGAFEYQGQKCSAASRAYIPSNLAAAVKEKLGAVLQELKMGAPEDTQNFINAVIDKKAYDRIVRYIELAKRSDDAELLFGGAYSDAEGYFIQPTVVLAKQPHFTTLVEEIFGPVLTLYVYPENEYEQTLHLVNATSVYALTGAVFAKDRAAIQLAHQILGFSAGNFYVNDKPTGAVVAQQPFGGARKSGTNDKSGSFLNLLRWLNPRTVKENYHPPTHHLSTYPYMMNASEEAQKRC